MPLFCAAALPAIERHLRVDLPAQIEAYKPVPCQLEFFFDRDDTRVTCDAWAAYGEVRHLLFGFETQGEGAGAPKAGTGTEAAARKTETPPKPSGPLRDERLEARAGELAARYLDAVDATLPSPTTRPWARFCSAAWRSSARWARCSPRPRSTASSATRSRA